MRRMIAFVTLIVAAVLVMPGCSNSHCDSYGCVDPSLSTAERDKLWRKYAVRPEPKPDAVLVHKTGPRQVPQWSLVP